MATVLEALLSKLKSTPTEAAFKAGGEVKFREYQAMEKDWDGVNEDAFFTTLLGEELAQKYIQSQGIVYGSKINLHNAYTLWGNSQYGRGEYEYGQKV